MFVRLAETLDDKKLLKDELHDYFIEDKGDLSEKAVDLIYQRLPSHLSISRDEVKNFMLSLPRGSVFFGNKEIKLKDHPELVNLLGQVQRTDYHPEYDSLVHTLKTLEKSKYYNPKVQYSTLTHDLGKGLTPDDMLPKHHGHEGSGVPLVENMSSRLNIPEDTKNLAKNVARDHLNFHKGLDLNPKTLRKLLKHYTKDELTQALQASKSDAQGRLGFENKEYPQEAFFQDLSNNLSESELNEENQKEVAKIHNKINELKNKYKK